MDALWAAEMFVLHQSPWLWLTSGPGAAPGAGWSPALIHQITTPSSPTPWGFGIECQGTAVILAWSFQFYKSDLSPRLTLMVSPSLVYGADDDVRGKCLKIELGSFWAMAELRARICFRSLRGSVNDEGKRQTKYMPHSLACVPANFHEQNRHPVQISDHRKMWFPQMKMWAENLSVLVNPGETVVTRKACRLLVYMKHCNDEFQRIKIYLNNPDKSHGIILKTVN